LGFDSSTLRRSISFGCPKVGRQPLPLFIRVRLPTPEPLGVILRMGFVVHCKRERYDVYIGRPSVYGNKFEIGKDGSREEVIAKYEEWLLGKPDIDPLGEAGTLW
jgi:hypothetical protein